MENKITVYTPSMRMRDLIDHDPMLLMALCRFDISLGFGDKSVAEVCREQGVDCPTFIAVTNFISFSHKPDGPLSLASLVKYLENAHEYFLKFRLPGIRRKLIEAIDCSGRDEVGMLILQFYDSYTDEVERHMEYENTTVFAYVKSLIEGHRDDSYNISIYSSGHHSIHDKLQDLKGLIIRYLPQRDTNLLNATLFDIVNCEEDLMSHCHLEDAIFVPAVANLEEKVSKQEAANAEVEEGDDTTVLSPRERDIVAGVARGLSNKEIADALCLSVHTVTTHRRNIAQKLEIHSPAGLTIYAVINGLVKIDELRNNL